ncbi:MAG: DUF4258 domain-containing protein [Vicinamibacteria bacterium]
MVKSRREFPDWWEWELGFWDHLKERMEQRPFTEVDLRLMIKEATVYKKARRPGRWILETRHRGSRWHVIVKPDYDTKILDVVTAYEVKRRDAKRREK